MRVAVTGASGFIGRRLLHVLTNAGHEVRALVRRRPPEDAPRTVAWVTGDLADASALTTLLNDVDAVVHGAGSVKALRADGFAAANVIGTATFAEMAAAQARPPRFVHLSSLAARAPHLSAYAASKAAGEAAVLRLIDRLPAVVLRPPAVYGPGDREALRVLQMAARGVLLVPGVPGARLSLAHVDDVANAIVAALAPAVPAGPLEFDDGRPGGYTWPDIAAAAALALGRPVRVLPVPPPALRLAGMFASAISRVTGRPSVLSADKVGEALNPDWVAAGPQLPGYTPGWSLAEGFRNTAEWAASQGLLRLFQRS
jgi:nucleoside-diphosphate-sugar epimerase